MKPAKRSPGPRSRNAGRPSAGARRVQATPIAIRHKGGNTSASAQVRAAPKGRGSSTNQMQNAQRAIRGRTREEVELTSVTSPPSTPQKRKPADRPPVVTAEGVAPINSATPVPAGWTRR